MIRRIAALTLALLATAALAQTDPLGVWRGAIGPGVIDLEIRITIAADEGDAGLTGTIDIPAQGLIGYPLVNVVHVGDALTFAMPEVPGDPTFDGVIEGDRLEGTFSQGGQPIAFALERAAEAGALRPQEPLPPFPYDEEEVEFASGDVTLAGTLTLPPGDGRAPGLLLITGSGPQDRNEEILGHKPFLVIADHLTRTGYAVLRVDDRGVGGSTGPTNSRPSTTSSATSSPASSCCERIRASTRTALDCSATARAGSWRPSPPWRPTAASPSRS
jgi:hypothetical protein